MCEWVSLRYSVMVTWWLWSLVCGALLGQHHGCRNFVVPRVYLINILHVTEDTYLNHIDIITLTFIININNSADNIKFAVSEGAPLLLCSKFCVRIGVKQGAVLTPFLSAVHMDGIYLKLKDSQATAILATIVLASRVSWWHWHCIYGTVREGIAIHNGWRHWLCKKT